jgi:hypothetical protein
MTLQVLYNWTFEITLCITDDYIPQYQHAHINILISCPFSWSCNPCPRRRPRGMRNYAPRICDIDQVPICERVSHDASTSGGIASWVAARRWWTSIRRFLFIEKSDASLHCSWSTMAPTTPNSNLILAEYNAKLYSIAYSDRTDLNQWKQRYAWIQWQPVLNCLLRSNWSESMEATICMTASITIAQLGRAGASWRIRRSYAQA